jgi:starch-binding outer membrane protein, SusD/RagB family
LQRPIFLLKAGWTTPASYKITRGTKGAAVAYKVRIYQHMWDMDKVITEGLKLVSGGTYGSEYALGAEPWTAFANNYSNTEYIYGMENSATNNPGVNAALASQYKNRQLVAISPIVWRNSYWLQDDKRRKEGIWSLQGRIPPVQLLPVFSPKNIRMTPTIRMHHL